MGLFFHEKDSDFHKYGTNFWKYEEAFSQLYLLHGQFIQINQSNNQRMSLQFSLSNEKIFITNDNQIRSLELCMTALQEHFYLQNGKKIYELRLMKDDLLTRIYTFDQKLFIDFYCHMAKFCILKNFEKHFKVSRQLGEGSFSVVYEGKSIYSNSQVALKVFQKKKLFQMQDGINIMKNQIINLEKLKLVNLSPLIQAYETQDCIILVLKKAECGHLIDYITEHTEEYDEKMAQKIMKNVFQNLYALHSAGFIHRDIKPENILFDNHVDNHVSSFRLFLSDFGLSVQKNAPRNQIGRRCSGTVGFVAPQVIQENQYDQKCDIFSAGCLLYFLLTGKSLFPNMKISEIKQLTEQNQYIQRRLQKLPRSCQMAKDLLIKILQVDPVIRFSAQQALNHCFFTNNETSDHQRIDTRSKLYGQDIDQTIREYIKKKVSNFWR